MSFSNVVIVCPRKCVSWPDVDFTDSEQGVLDAVYDFVSENMCKSSHTWVTSFIRFFET
jgi:hypothetical protein